MTDVAAPPHTFQGCVYLPDGTARDVSNAQDLNHALEQDSAFGWVDCGDPTPAFLAHLDEELGFHRLSLEDALEAHERPKVDRYETHLFLTATTVVLDLVVGTPVVSAVKAFVTPKLVVLVHDGTFDAGPLIHRWHAETELARYGVGFLVWALLDQVVDAHFEAVQQLDDDIEVTEDILFGDGVRPRDLQRRVYQLRKRLATLRRIALPMREVLNTLMRRDADFMDPGMIPYLQDVYDHVLRVSEWTDSLRDLATAMLDTQVAVEGNRMNLIMKKVTSWAAIIAVPAAVTGFYGQNVPFPGFGQASGMLTSVALIVSISAALYLVFKRKDWI
jgi:magnesium transporter